MSLGDLPPEVGEQIRAHLSPRSRASLAAASRRLLEERREEEPYQREAFAELATYWEFAYTGEGAPETPYYPYDWAAVLRATRRYEEEEATDEETRLYWLGPVYFAVANALDEGAVVPMELFYGDSWEHYEALAEIVGEWLAALRPEDAWPVIASVIANMLSAAKEDMRTEEGADSTEKVADITARVLGEHARRRIPSAEELHDYRDELDRYAGPSGAAAFDLFLSQALPADHYVRYALADRELQDVLPGLQAAVEKVDIVLRP